jgi:dTDP-glucose pyrophosphorylase
MQILIPMAGSGKRFAEAGYKEPKPLIPVGGKPMIKAVIDNLSPLATEWLFVIRKEDKDYLPALLREYTNNNCKVIIAAELTQGAACSSMLAESVWKINSPLLIANCDQIITGDITYIKDAVKGDYSGAVVTTYIGNGDPKWSYARVINDQVVEVKEKTAISNRATVGIYWYATANLFKMAVETMQNWKDTTNGEYYVAPTFNYVWGKIRELRLEDFYGQFHSLGTPELLQQYVKVIQ